MAINGLRTTSNFVTDQRPKNWRETILLLYPNGKAPLTALTSLMKSEKTDDPEYNWWTKTLSTRRVALGANMLAGDTVITVTSGAKQFKQGDILWVEESGVSTPDLMIVSQDPSSDTSLTVTRGFAGSTASAVTYNGNGVNPNLRAIGSAYEEGSQAPTGVAYDPVKVYNYTQIFRNTLEHTRTAQKTRLRTGDAVKEAKRECLEYHSIDMEMGLILGLRSEGTYQGKPRRTTGGIISYIDSGNIQASSTTLDMETFEGYLKRMFDFGSSEKIAFCGNLAALTVNQVVRKNSSYNIQFGIKEYGMNVARLVTPFGELVLKTHPLFNQMTGGTTGTDAYYGMEAWMLVIDPKELVYRYVDDTMYQQKLQDNGLDGEKSGYLTECGLEIHHPKTHFLLTGLRGGIASVDS